MEIKAPSKLKKVGYCDDCGHLWDINREFDEQIIANDLKKVVDNLLEKFKSTASPITNLEKK